uniref:Uncharacterized protein n=1 Tax=Oryctolagus cuniculus TaxID=9986 RepID=A0A5F9CTB1_RABIT
PNGTRSQMLCQENQEFVQPFSQIVKVLTEVEMGHPEIGDAIALLKEIMEYIGGKYIRGLRCDGQGWHLHPRQQMQG